MRAANVLRSVPIIGPTLRHLKWRFKGPRRGFTSSENYWTERYKRGGNSGRGSYDRLAEFKARVLNRFVEHHDIRSVIEYGAGDGNQLALACYPDYLGFDISPVIVAHCAKKFANDPSKRFRLMHEYDGERAELTLSLDVIYHLVEDATFTDYMHRLFDSADRFVIIYSSNHEENLGPSPSHVRHRKFSQWVSQNKADWLLVDQIPNEYPPASCGEAGSFADFFVYQRGA